MEDLKKVIELLETQFAQFQTLVEKPDNKSKQKKARNLSNDITKTLKDFRAKSVLVGKIPE